MIFTPGSLYNLYTSHLYRLVHLLFSLFGQEFLLNTILSKIESGEMASVADWLYQQWVCVCGK
jgi:hypothetical protein